MVGNQQASLPVPTAEDVPPYCSHGAEGVQPCHLLGQMGAISGTRPGDAEPYTIELIGPESTREEITEIYLNVYQLQRLPGKMLCGKDMEEHICQEIMDSVKECLWCRWVPTLPGRN